MEWSKTPTLPFGRLLSSLASPNLPDPAFFAQIPLGFPERQGLPHPSGPVLW